MSNACQRPRREGRLALILLVGVLIAILGAKFHLIQHLGSDLPFWDQWDGEGDRVYSRDARGILTLGDFFLPHNEHRIVFTKALAYALLKINGQWDARLEMTVNAILHVLALGLLLALLLRRRTKDSWTAGAIICLVVFSLPVGWENTLGGFQSPFAFLCLFSIAHLGGTFLATKGGKIWWSAQFAGLCALFSMASGFISAVIILGMLGLKVIRSRRLLPSEWGLFGFNSILVAAGLWLRVEVPGHAELKAHGLFQFLGSLASVLAWPSPLPIMACLAFLPLAIVLWHWLKNKPEGEENGFVFALLLWWLSQVLALAHTRGGTSAVLSSRYFDLLGIGTVLITMLWFDAIAYTRFKANRLLQLIWVLAVLAGLNWQYHLSETNFLRPMSGYNQNRIDQVRSYVVNQSKGFFSAQPFVELPYPDVHRLANLLTDPGLRAILPMSVRPSLSLANQLGEGTRFIEVDSAALPGGLVGYRTWTSTKNPPSEATQGKRFQSEWIAPPHERFLRFWVMGTDGLNRDALWIETKSGREPVLIPASADDRWKSVVIDSPKELFRVAAKTDGDQPVSFTEPVELGFGSWLARVVLKSGDVLFFFGLALIVLPALILLRPIPRLILKEIRQIRPPKLKSFMITLVAAAVIISLRKPDVLRYPQFWAEDGSLFFAMARQFGLRSILLPYAGYMLVLPHMLAVAADTLSTLAQPAVYVWGSFVIILWMAGSIFSPRIQLPFKPVLVLAMVLVPHSGEVFLNPTNLQWFTGIGLLLIALKTEPAEEWKNLLDGFLAAIFGLTGPFAIMFAPIFLLRIVRLRTRGSILLAAIVILVGLMQAVVLVHFSPPAEPAGVNHHWLLALLLYRCFGLVLLGHFGASLGLGITAFAGLVAFLALGAALAQLKQFRWEVFFLASAFFIFVLSIAVRIRGTQDVLMFPGFGDRYFYVPKVMFLWFITLSALRFPKTAFSVLLIILVLNLPEFRFPAYADFHWKEMAARIDQHETFWVYINPTGIAFYNAAAKPTGVTGLSAYPLPLLAWLSGGAACGLLAVWTLVTTGKSFFRKPTLLSDRQNVALDSPLS